MMSRQAYFYRVPPQELHRRNQLQADPAKTRALQTVIDMKVGLTVNFELSRAGNILGNDLLHGVSVCVSVLTFINISVFAFYNTSSCREMC